MLKIKHITHCFGNPADENKRLLVLNNISMDIEDGTFVSFIGPSGCGKTTLLRIIDGLIRQTAGEVIVDGNTVTGPSAERAVVFQGFNLLPWRNALRNVEFGLELQGVRKRTRTRLALAALRTVGLESFTDFSLTSSPEA